YLSADWSPGVTFDRAHSGPLDIAAMLGVLGLAALTWVLVVWLRGVWRWRFTDAVAALAAACIGYSVWVAFNFDWAPATGVFWLLAGSAWSGVRTAEAAPVHPASTQPQWAAPARTVAAIAMAVALIGLAVLPVLADVWYFQNRADLSVRADPLQSRYHWALGQELIADGKTAAAAAEFRS